MCVWTARHLSVSTVMRQKSGQQWKDDAGWEMTHIMLRSMCVRRRTDLNEIYIAVWLSDDDNKDDHRHHNRFDWAQWSQEMNSLTCSYTSTISLLSCPSRFTDNLRATLWTMAHQLMPSRQWQFQSPHRTLARFHFMMFVLNWLDSRDSLLIKSAH